MAEKVLTEHRDGMVRLAELLLEREVVFTEDVENIFGKRKKDVERERIEAERLAAMREGEKELKEIENKEGGAETGAGEPAAADKIS